MMTQAELSHRSLVYAISEVRGEMTKMSPMLRRLIWLAISPMTGGRGCSRQDQHRELAILRLRDAISDWER